MLSLRDSGKIQQDNASLTDLARQCDLTVPFSLKDFIEKDCLVEVTNFRICVVLFIPWRLFFPWQPEYTRRLFIATKHDRAWYENYFLNWRNPNGIAQYWHKETFGRVKVEGDVLDWTVEFDDPADILDRDDQNNPKGKPVDRFQPGNRVAREKVAALAAKIALQKGVSVGDYDGLIAVVRMPHNWNIDGDWGGAANFLKSANFIDGRGDFAFYAHEVGHVIGFKYNFDH